jgi:recombination protein RecA
MAGVIEKSGSWYSYEGERLGQGRQNAQSFLKDNPDINNSISKKVKEALDISKKKQEGTEGDS